MLKRAALLIVSTILAVGIGEAVLRTVPIAWFYSAGYMYDMSEEFHHSYRPGDDFVRRPQPPDDFSPVENRVNSFAMRGPEPTAGPVRALLLGDSFIQATAVQYESTAGQLLERRLREHDPHAVVLSHGIGSWSPLLEWNWYLKVGHQFHARDVFLFVFHNDFDPQYEGLSDVYYLKQAVFGPDGRPERFNVASGSPIWRTLRRLRLAALWRLLKLRLENAQSPSSAESGGARLLDAQTITQWLDAPQNVFEERLAQLGLPSTWEGFWRLQRPLRLWPTQLRQSVDLSESVITRFAEDVARDHGQLVLVYVPMGMQVGPRECSASRDLYGVGPNAVIEPRSGIQEWLEAMALKHRIEWLDPTDQLRAASAAAERPMYLAYDCHWSPTGHERIATILADWLAANRRS